MSFDIGGHHIGRLVSVIEKFIEDGDGLIHPLEKCFAQEALYSLESYDKIDRADEYVLSGFIERVLVQSGML
jgi:hypothetical protein